MRLTCATVLASLAVAAAGASAAEITGADQGTSVNYMGGVSIGTPTSFIDSDYTNDFVSGYVHGDTFFSPNQVWTVTEIRYGDRPGQDWTSGGGGIGFTGGHGSRQHFVDTSDHTTNPVTPMIRNSSNTGFFPRKTGMFRWHVDGGAHPNGSSGGSDFEVFASPTGHYRIPDPVIQSSTPQFNAGFAVANIYDDMVTHAGSNEYASLGGGNNTFIVFDFGAPWVQPDWAIKTVELWDRSGGSWSDATLTFSDDLTFGNAGDVAYTITGQQEITLLDLTVTMDNTAAIHTNGVAQRYLRWQVTAFHDANNGLGEVAFYGTLIPEPACLSLLTMVGLGMLRRRV